MTTQIGDTMAAVATVLKEECERQHARAEKAEAALAAQETRTCETCRYAGPRYTSFEARICKQLAEKPVIVQPRWVTAENDHIVPLTINGRPFSCAGWTPKEDA